MSNLYRGPSINASYQVLVHLVKWFQRRRNFFKLTNQKQEMPVAAMFVNGSGRNVQSFLRTIHRCFLPSFSSFGQAVSEEKIFFQKSTNQKQQLPMAAIFVNRPGQNEQSLQRTFHRCFIPSFRSFGQAISEQIFRNRPIRTNNCLWRPCLLTDRDEMCNLYR